MRGRRADATTERLRSANPVGAPPPELPERPGARALRQRITAMAQDPPATRARRRWRSRPLAMALAGAVLVGGVAYGAARWSADDLPSAGTGADAFVLPDTTILPGGYESTRAPRYLDIPERPSILFPAGATYGEAAAAYLAARRRGEVLPPGTRLADPLPSGVIAQVRADGVRLDPAAPFGYSLDTGLVGAPGAGVGQIDPAAGMVLPRCQLLLGDERPASSPSCPIRRAARVMLHREVDGRWRPFSPARVVPALSDSPTTMALLERPVTEGDRLPDDMRAMYEQMWRMIPGDKRAGAGLIDPAHVDRARLAGTAVGGRVWAIPGDDGRVCMVVRPRDDPHGGMPGTCGALRELAVRGVLSVTSTDRRTGSRVWALVADGYTTARVDGGRPLPIRGNLVGARSGPHGGRVITLSGPVGTTTVRVP